MASYHNIMLSKVRALERMNLDLHVENRRLRKEMECWVAMVDKVYQTLLRETIAKPFSPDCPTYVEKWNSV